MELFLKQRWLTISPSKYLVALISGLYKEKKDKLIFIDRDPGIFKHILRLLRDPTYPFPDKFTGELDFYCIDVDIDKSEPVEEIYLPRAPNRIDVFTNIKEYRPYKFSQILIFLF